MKLLTLIALFIGTFWVQAQTTITGTILDNHGVPIYGANIYLEGTYDGATSDDQGHFEFTTDEKGEQTLVVSFIAFQTYSLKAEVNKMKGLQISLKEEINTLTGVTLTAGTFEAGDKAKNAVLKPMDVVTTAGAMGDYIGALQTLPATTKVAEDGRLFVRGGEADETQIFIDGMRVFSAYTPTANNMPTRGRYSSFLFNGISFSTGGYSAEYGQALSSVLALSTINEPSQDMTNISIMSVGLGLGHTKKWNKSSLSVNTSYFNLGPYLKLFPDRNNWEKPYENLAGETVYRYHFNSGTLKWYTAFDHTGLEVHQEDINYDDKIRFKLTNDNLYTNVSYKGVLANDWIITTGGSLSYSKNKYGIVNDNIDQEDISYHAKVKLKKSFSRHIKLSTGVEYFSTNFKEDFKDEADFRFSSEVANTMPAAFVESDIFFTNNLAMKVGLRSSYSSVNDNFSLEPRAALAYKTGKASQVSVAYGDFYQNPANTYLKFDKSLQPAKAQHYIFNYQYIANGRTFRAETYYKDYSKLVSYEGLFAEYDSNYKTNGYGYATGLDIFWRDNKSFKNMDYWVSYSFLDTQRKYQNYETEATPYFAAKHNLSIVTKYWIDDLKSQLGVTYSFASGRPYDNPNSDAFMSGKTKSYNNLSLSWAYLVSQQQILYLSLSNPLGFQNINGYQYANSPNNAGVYDRRSIKPNADTFFMIGFFWTISTDKTKNQLDNL